MTETLPSALDHLPDLTDASCRMENSGIEPDLWTSVAPTEYQVAAMRSICHACPVRVECLTWAISHNEYGVWGGLTHEERRRLAVRYCTNCGTRIFTSRRVTCSVTCADARTGRGSPRAPRPVAPCGTRAAVRRHARHHEPLCRACDQWQHRASAEAWRARRTKTADHRPEDA